MELGSIRVSFRFLNTEKEYVTLWIGGGKVDVWRDSLVFKSQHHFDDTGESRCAFAMANVWFYLDN
jgi:hypothetical protein